MTNGLIFSQRVMLELTKYGFSREQAYRISSKKCSKIMEKKYIIFSNSLSK